MKVNIYYGGRGLIDDPSIFVMNKLEQVLDELNVRVERFNLYELKNTITTLSQTVTDADAVVLTTTVEWLGMGGYMQEFLDACWLYADKNKISSTYMFPVVMAKAYGEREVALTMANSWEIIGGKAEPPLTAYVDDTTEFEFNKEYVNIIEKYAESIYRTVSQKRTGLPTSNQTIKNSVIKETINFTPQESEQLSKYVSDDTFVKTQKKDIESLASIYKELLSDQENGGDNYYIDVFNNSFNRSINIASTYMIMISDKNKDIIINVQYGNLTVAFGQNPNADVICKLTKEHFDNIVQGKTTFHRSFMTGDMTAKGNLKTLRMLDELFIF